MKNEVVLGAWLFKADCTRCHSSYDESRLAENYEDTNELIEAFTSGACHVNWSRAGGGLYGSKELRAVSAFMNFWEEHDEPPSLPTLPPGPQRKVTKQKVGAAKKTLGESEESVSKSVLSPALTKLIARNRVAEGGYLYTNHCYRCHLSYEQARMGKGIKKAGLKSVISEGKTSTQMKPFSRILGGKLKNSEIDAVSSYIITWERFGESPAIAHELMVPPAFDPSEFKPLRLPQFRKVSGDSVNGKNIFQTSCISCHGERGEGLIGSSLLQIKGLRSDLYAKSIIKVGIPNSIMRPWSQSGGGILSAKDVDDTVSFLMDLHSKYITD